MSKSANQKNQKNRPKEGPGFLDAAARRRVALLGTQVDDVTLEQATDLIVSWVQQRRLSAVAPARLVITLNPEYVIATRRNPSFRQVVNSADLVTPDGAGVIAAGKILGQPFRQRVTGVALCEKLFERSAQKEGPRLFLLGAQAGVAEEAARKLGQEYPGIQIAGTWAGQAGPEGDAEAVERIRQAGAEIILVAYGMLKQDWWSVRNLTISGAAVALGVGGVLDYKAGRVPLAPRRLRQWGLEWAYRLYKEPWRWRRQLALPQFVFLVLLEKLRRVIRK
jgi:N-acetylglucosaminyldiphosphoundecaprenol N-acetyl-beta-D-mannosaminyltransferase